MMKTTIALSILTLTVLGMAKAVEPDIKKPANPPENALKAITLADIKDGDFTLKITRVAKHPRVQFPSDPIPDDAYAAAKDEPARKVKFSDALKKVTILPRSIKFHFEAENNWKLRESKERS